MLRAIAIALLLSTAAYAKPPEGYKVVGYSEPASGSPAKFTVIHANIKITATCQASYGTKGTCDRLNFKVGETIPWPQMMNLSPITLEYNPDNSGTCASRPNCEFLHITAQEEIH